MAAQCDLLWFSGRVTTGQAVSGESSFLSLSPLTLPPLSCLSAPLCLPSTSDRALEDGPGKGEGWGEFTVPLGDTSPVKEPQPHPPIWKARAMTSLRPGQLQISSVSRKPPEKSGLSPPNLWLFRPSEGVLSNRAPGAGSGETSRLSLWQPLYQINKAAPSHSKMLPNVTPCGMRSITCLSHDANPTLGTLKCAKCCFVSIFAISALHINVCMNSKDSHTQYYPLYR